MAFAVIACNAHAQTLTEPAPHTARAAKAPGAAKTGSLTGSCEQYGRGFVPVPGTDLCIKLGGYVTTEGTGSR